MSEMMVLGFENEMEADRFGLKLAELQKDMIVQLSDAAEVVRDPDGKPHVKHGHGLVGAGAMGGAFWGMLFGLLFFMPFLGMAIGAGLGALFGKGAKTGIDKQVLEQMHDAVPPGKAGWFLVIEPDDGGQVPRRHRGHARHARALQPHGGAGGGAQARLRRQEAQEGRDRLIRGRSRSSERWRAGGRKGRPPAVSFFGNQRRPAGSRPARRGAEMAEPTAAGEVQAQEEPPGGVQRRRLRHRHHADGARDRHPGENGEGTHLLSGLAHEWPVYLTYFVSFMTIGAVWIEHSAMVDALDHVDGVFMRLNLVLLLFCAFLPFPTRLMRSSPAISRASAWRSCSSAP